MELDADMYDDDYSGHAQARTEAANPQDVSPGNSVRQNALHLRGVDDMSTANIHAYLSLYTTESKPRIEWIDDTSLNLVYYTAEDAKVALERLVTTSIDLVSSNDSVPAQGNPEKPDSRLEIRFAKETDKKERGAKDRSRWYLFHPEDDPDSRTRHRGDGRSRRREEPYSKTRRNERRVPADTASKADLFADRLGVRTQSPSERPIIKADLFEEKTANNIKGEDLFASRVLEAAKVSQKRIHESSRNQLPAGDLFSRIDPPSSLSSLPLAARISGSKSASGDLFANRGRLTDRLGGPVRGAGLSIRGADRRTKASDLF